MTEYEIIQSEIKAVEQKYYNSAMDVISDYNNEEKTKDDYRRRQIFELLQNADDCYSDTYPEINVKFELRDNYLIVQNTGRPFSARGIISLMHTDASSKYEGTIGCKGLGFRAVLNWAKEIIICTSDFSISFSERRAVEKLDQIKRVTKANYAEELNRLRRTAILTVPELLEEQEAERWLASDYSTAIVLNCKDECVQEIREQLKTLRFGELLFLDHIRKIEIIDNDTRIVESKKDKYSCSIIDNGLVSKWRLWEESNRLTMEDGTSKRYELKLAYNLDREEQETLRKDGVLYSYFPTDISMPFPFLVHGTFELTSERNGLVKDNRFNELVLQKLIDFMGRIGEEIALNHKESNYEALRFLLPSSSLGQLDKEYSFSWNLKAKIKKLKVFPAINDDYVSLDPDSVYYSENRFDLILVPETCSTLLKHADDDVISSFLRASRVFFYEDETLVALINRDAQYYVDTRKNVELIGLFCEKYTFPKTAPNLLTDEKGELISSDVAKVFINPQSQPFKVPEWSDLRFLNSDLKKALKKRLGPENGTLTDGDLAKKLSSFHVSEYRFEQVLKELVSQSKDDPEKTKETVHWLFIYWNNNDRKFDVTFNTIEARILSRGNEIVPVSKCYFGKEYGNDRGERLASLLDDTVFVASPSALGLEHEDAETIKTFFRSLGVKRFPTVEKRKLNQEERKEYIRYNQRYYPRFKDYYGNLYTANEFFYQWEQEILVSGISGIEQLVSKAEFSDLVIWLLEDKTLLERVTDENEPDDSRMKGKPFRARSFYDVNNRYMRSYLRKAFVETAWLPTKTGIKTTIGNCTLAPHDLSPLVEVLDVDFDYLIKESGKSRKDFELLFEKLGVADDVSDLSKHKIYELLTGLYKNQFDHNITKSVYSNLNLRITAEKVDELIIDNPAYEEFKKKGGVLAEKNGEYGYYPVEEVYYVDRRKYCGDLLKNYPLLALGKKSGALKVPKMFCVKAFPVTDDNIKIKYDEHSLSKDYAAFFRKLLPYLYAKRMGADSKNQAFRNLKNARIVLVERANVSFDLDGAESSGVLEDFEMISKNRDYYIKIPTNLSDLAELRKDVRFTSAVANAVATVFGNDSDTDAFFTILRFNSIGEIEEYYKTSDDFLVIKEAKKRFADLVDSKTEFWRAVNNVLAPNSVDPAKYSDLMTEFRYNDLASETTDSETIIALFENLGISIEKYNNYAYELVDLRPFYKAKLRKIQKQYRTRFLLYWLEYSSSPVQTVCEYNLKKTEYDVKDDFDVSNSISVNLEEEFGKAFHIQIDKLKEVPDDNERLKQLSAKLSKEPALPTPKKQSEKSFPTTDPDAISIFERIKEKTPDGNSVSGVLLKASDEQRRTGSEGSGRSGGYGSQRVAKEENGFLAECKVYWTLKNRIGESGSVEWVSENGRKAGENTDGNDSLGYDIRYSDDSGVHYVEVKGSVSSDVEFFLSRNELLCAQQHPDKYEIWYVPIKDKNPETPMELGNLLKMESGESFISNDRFSVENNEFVIRAKIVHTEEID